MILFLDFDGVLHRNLIGDNSPTLTKLPLLWDILRRCPGVEVVLSTTWREHYKFEDMVFVVTRNGGEDLVHRFVGETPLIPLYPRRYPWYGMNRQNECVAWLEGSGFADRPWLALDDVPGIFAHDCANLFLVDPRTGLTEAMVPGIVREIEARTRPALQIFRQSA